MYLLIHLNLIIRRKEEKFLHFITLDAFLNVQIFRLVFSKCCHFSRFTWSIDILTRSTIQERMIIDCGENNAKVQFNIHIFPTRRNDRISNNCCVNHRVLYILRVKLIFLTNFHLFIDILNKYLRRWAKEKKKNALYLIVEVV